MDFACFQSSYSHCPLRHHPEDGPFCKRDSYRGNLPGAAIVFVKPLHDYLIIQPSFLEFERSCTNWFGRKFSVPNLCDVVLGHNLKMDKCLREYGEWVGKSELDSVLIYLLNCLQWAQESFPR